MAARTATLRIRVGSEAGDLVAVDQVPAEQVCQRGIDATCDGTAVVSCINRVDDQLLCVFGVMGVGARLSHEQLVVEGSTHGVGSGLAGAPVFGSKVRIVG